MTSTADRARAVAGALARRAWDRVADVASIRPGSAHARRFRHFGDRSVICFPVATLYGEEYISIGDGCIIGPSCTMSVGVEPGHAIDPAPGIRIGRGVLLGRGSGIVAHESVEVGDDVFTGHHVYITDANHGYEDVSQPIGRQFAASRPVVVGAGSWLGHGAIVLPGACVGSHVVIGAGSVVTGTIPDRSVAVGNPARVVRRHVAGEGWVSVPHTGPSDEADTVPRRGDAVPERRDAAYVPDAPAGDG